MIVFGVQAVDGQAGESREVLFAFGGGLRFCVRHFEPIVNTKKVAGKPRPQRNRLQLARAAERTNREEKEQQCESDGGGEEPVGYVARPGAQGYVEPDDAEKCK